MPESRNNIRKHLQRQMLFSFVAMSAWSIGHYNAQYVGTGKKCLLELFGELVKRRMMVLGVDLLKNLRNG